jgi:endonuclease/exonuclease/phosphatase family metal-dependent hydrolase
MKNMSRLILFILFFISVFFHSQAQVTPADKIRVVFYNVENLFDVLNDSLKMDDEFTPEGEKRWTYGRYKTKLSNIYKVLIAIGGWEPAGIIGLCEVENYRVLADLVDKTPLSQLNYQIIHKESADFRGIDVALLYRREVFRPIEYEPIPVQGKSPDEWFSREILYVKGVVFETDTVHLFVNHWPSRSGGQARSAPRRIYAASVLREWTDSLFRYEKNPKIIIMGDFNDNPDDKSMQVLTGGESGLVNLMTGLYKKGQGTLAHTDTFMQWHLFDQIIVSSPIADGSNLSVDEVTIFSPDWLKDKKTGRPFRTYQGPVYIGGYSDHFPVYFDLKKK